MFKRYGPDSNEEGVLKGKHCFLTVLLLFIFAVSFARSAGWPNDWAFTHWLINYQEGFIKRGLMGTIFEPIVFWDHRLPNVRRRVDIISAIFLGLFWLTLFMVIRRMVIRTSFHFRTVLFVTLFLLSPFTVQSAHLIGFFDSILMLLGLVSIFFILRGHPTVSGVIVSCSLFVHESALVMIYPVVITTGYLIYKQKNPEFSCKSLMQFTRLHLLLIIGPWIAFILIAGLQTYTLSEDAYSVPALQKIHALHWIPEKTFFGIHDTFTTSFWEYFETQSPKFFPRIVRLPYFVGSLLPLIAMFFLLRSLLKPSLVHPFERVMVILGAFSPLMLLAVAWDFARIHSFPYFSVLTVFWISAEINGKQKLLEMLSTKHLIFYAGIALLFIINNSRLFNKQPDNLDICVRLILLVPPVVLVFFLAPPINLLQPKNGNSKSQSMP